MFLLPSEISDRIWRFQHNAKDYLPILFALINSVYSGWLVSQNFQLSPYSDVSSQYAFEWKYAISETILKLVEHLSGFANPFTRLTKFHIFSKILNVLSKRIIQLDGFPNLGLRRLQKAARSIKGVINSLLDFPGLSEVRATPISCLEAAMVGVPFRGVGESAYIIFLSPTGNQGEG